MKMFKRLAAFAVVLSMVLAMLPATVSAATLPTDVKGTKYEDAASLLCALEIMVGDGEKFNPDNNVTRAEFAKILVTTMGHLDTASAFTAQGVFDDVATSEWYAPFVEFAAQLGAINGYGEGKFGPNDNVTGYQAIKMICFASGHNACINDPIAGYPQEYFNVAKEYEFLKGLSDVNFSEPMTRGQVAILAANVLKADMLKLTGSSSESGSSYAVMEGVTLLSSKHDVYKFEGLVTTNEKTGIFGASNLDAGEVQIEKGADVRVFLTGESGIEDAIGTYVKAYYKDDDDLGTQTVVSFDASSTKNTKITLAQDFVDLDDSTDTLIKYWADGDKDAKTKKMEIVRGVPVIWNGAASDYTSLTEAIADAANMQAQVEFLDYDGDNKMDIVSIKAYDTYVIDRIDADNYIITDEVGNWSTGVKKTKKLTVDIEDEAKVITISDVDGEEYAFEDLAVGDVLSVAESQDGKVIDIKVSMDTVEGTINSIGTVDNKWVFEIEGEDYALAKSYAEYITKGNESATIADLGVKINKSYEFKLDVFGQLAFSDTVAGAAKGEFGFITFYAPGEGADAGINVRMFAAGSVDVYGLADTVTIDGEKYKGLAEITSAMEASIASYIPASKAAAAGGYYGDGAWSGIPVLFELNDESQIKYIDTPTLGEDEDKYTLQPTKSQLGNIVVSGFSSNSFGSSRPLASTVNIIQLPGKDSELNIAEKYSTAKNFNTSTDYYVQLFSTDPDTYASNYVIIAKGAAGSKDVTFTTDIAKGLDDAETVNGGSSGAGVKTTPLFVVKSVSRGIAGEDDEETIMITGFENGAEVTYTVDPDYYASGYIYQTMENYYKKVNKDGELSSVRTAKVPIMEGDVLRLARNKTSKLVTFIAPVFYMAEKALFAQMNNGYLNNNDIIYCAIDIATVKELDGNQGVLSYLIKNYKNSQSYSGLFTIDDAGRLVPPAEKEGYKEGEDDVTDVIMTETGYEGDFTKMHNIGGFTKITTYNADEPAGKRVKKGSLSDIVTLEDASNKTNPSIVLMHYRTQSDANYSMVVLNF